MSVLTEFSIGSIYLWYLIIFFVSAYFFRKRLDRTKEERENIEIKIEELKNENQGLQAHIKTLRYEISKINDNNNAVFRDIGNF